MDSGEHYLLQNQRNDVEIGITNKDKHPFQEDTPPSTPTTTINESSNHRPISGMGNSTFTTHRLEDDFIKSLQSTGNFKPKSGRTDGGILNDMHAISMMHLSERDFSEMNTDKDFVSNTSFKRNNRLSSGVLKMFDENHKKSNIYDTNITSKTTPKKCQEYSGNNDDDNLSSFNTNENERIDFCKLNHTFDKNLSTNNSLYFADGIKSVDFVLAYEINANPIIEKANEEKRKIFQENLINSQGLEIEKEVLENELNFVKIHAPMEVLRRYAEILKLRMPMKESSCEVLQKNDQNRLQNAAHYISEKIPGFSGVRNTTNNLYSQLKGIWASMFQMIFVDEKYFPRRSQRFTAIYSRDKEYLFDLEQESFFTSAIRSRIVQFILDRQKFSSNSSADFAFGIERLVADGVYLAAYPLHDGEISVPGSKRYLLYKEWASVKKWYQYQPLDYIKEYFGVKIGLYFAWLGYYTYMLLLASIVGVLCFVYSWKTLDDYVPVKDICSDRLNDKMCPLCDWCSFWDIKETCFYSKITYLIDNPSTVFFAVFMSFWATLFLELWKRYSAEITHRWDLTGFDVHEEHPRPQYLARLAHVRKMRIDYVTNTKEPQPPFWRMKLPAAVLSFSVVLLLVTLAFAAVLGVVVYRMSVLTSLKVRTNPMTTSSAIMLSTASAACINLILIYFLNYMYTYLAEYLTELELWRTQTEFDDSLTLKIYLLHFVNYYASIFYIAFFKGKFVGHPGNYNKLFDYRQEECSSGGCLTELCIQLAIIMIGKQAMNSILEMVMPIFWKWVNIMRVGWFNKNRNTSEKDKKGERWLRDLKLVEWGPRSLFPEYLEMVLQYGFVTIFVSAFPLAPLFALLNNILEMRLDAKKLLTYHRRPVSQRVRDIGVWYRILDCISKLSVITNGFIIAFTSDFIPRLVYLATNPEDTTLDGYLNFTLSSFNISDSSKLRSLAGDGSNITVCRFADYRNPPGTKDPYNLSNMFYVILASRLAFVVIFENLVAFVMILVRWCIPDMSIQLRDQIRREAYITNEIIIKQETLRARAERAERELMEVVEPNMNFIKMEQLMSSNLSQSQLDLIIHGPGNPTGVSGNSENLTRRDVNNEINYDASDTGPISL